MSYEQELKELRDTYAAELTEKLAAINSDLILLQDHSDNALLIKLIRKVHSLIGSSATFGFIELSQAAAQLEKRLRLYQEQTQGVAFTPEDFQQLFQALVSAARQPPNDDFNTDKPFPLKTAHLVENKKPCLLLISANETFTIDLNTKLKAYDIQTQVHSALTELLSCIQKTNPCCILIDITSIENPETQINAFYNIGQKSLQLPPLIIISEQDNMLTRLSAVRSGALAYFSDPIVNMPELVTLIREQCFPVKEPPYRVLLIDDDAQFAHHTALLLQRAGMETKVITQPMTVLETLALFQPELILLDLYMPECNGLELAAVIRQQCLYTGISIVFFSVELDINRHIDALRAGGNDFFVKGLPPKQLIAKVEAKTKHARAIQELMQLDALTGLSNRTHFTEIISKQLAYSQRHKRCFCFVMLDLDHFKQVNDQFGHQAGDEVLRSLASLITQRLRSVDTAIRYGGEEIVILLPETKANQAKRLINELLQKFSTITFTANKQPFSVTFSAGISEYPKSTDLAELIKAADKALYKAKAEGRNQVCLA